MGRKHGRARAAYEKDQKALEKRKEGHTYESISKQLGYSTPSASYKAVMRRLRDMDRPAVSMLRELEVQRLVTMVHQRGITWTSMVDPDEWADLHPLVGCPQVLHWNLQRRAPEP